MWLFRKKPDQVIDVNEIGQKFTVWHLPEVALIVTDIQTNRDVTGYYQVHLTLIGRSVV